MKFVVYREERLDIENAAVFLKVKLFSSDFKLALMYHNFGISVLVRFIQRLNDFALLKMIWIFEQIFGDEDVFSPNMRKNHSVGGLMITEILSFMH